MRTISLFLLLTVGSLEHVYEPYARPARGGAHGIAAAGGGVLMVWSANDAHGRPRVHVARLDSGARLVSPVTVLPALTPGRDAIVPSIATDGTSFLVVWEEVFGMQQTVGMLVDANGVPAGTPRALTADTPVLDNVFDPPAITWLGETYAVRGDSRLAVNVRRDGTVAGAITDLFPMAVAADGSRASAEVRLTVTGFPGIGSHLFPPQYAVSWAAGRRNGTETVGTQAPSAPVMAAAGNEFAIVWTTPDAVHYRMTTGQRYSIHANVDALARPRVSCSETRCIVAYATRSGDVQGFTFDPGQPYSPQLFVAAASERQEREPELLILSDSRGVIVYRSSASDERLAGRTLQFGAAKRRAAR